jgi:hypothetical protein
MDDVELAASGGVDEDPEESEVVDGVLVLANARTIEPVREAAPPLRAVAAVAATGFVAGAATAAVLGRRMSRHQARRAASALPALRPAGEPLDVVSSRRFIVDVHTLARR